MSRRNAWVPKAAIWFITLVGAALAGLGVFFIVVGIGEWRSGEASRTWPTVEGRVLVSEVSTSRGPSRPGPSTTTSHELRYEYEVDGVRREGTRLSFKVAMGEQDLLARAARFPAGSAAAVHVDPEDPERAVLEPGADGWNALPIAMGGLAVLFPAAVVAFAWRLCLSLGVL